MFDLAQAIHPNILALVPYHCACDDYKDGALLGANENALGPTIPSHPLGLHHYPDPSHPAIKTCIATLHGLPLPMHVFLGISSDKVIDLLIRITTTPTHEKILITPPTYGMYAICTQINNISILKIPLQLTPDAGEGGDSGRFSTRIDNAIHTVAADPTIKLIFLCSPGNPTGTLISLGAIKAILQAFDSIVMVDEAYIDFSPPGTSAACLIQKYPNLVVMQTLSKSFGLVAIRLSIALTQPLDSTGVEVGE
ncbi:hypothetical protein APHAL10511_008421 [Amanita phalloides]|nr:hypothetical protein APHAL10511_008421 [Amanita phalloides]